MVEDLVGFQPAHQLRALCPHQALKHLEKKAGNSVSSEKKPISWTAKLLSAVKQHMANWDKQGISFKTVLLLWAKPAK